MVAMLYKWFFALLFIGGSSAHPVYVSVTEVEHNAADKTLEISCKVFIDDFEKALRKQFSGKVDLLNPPDKAAANKMVAAYIQQHLQIRVDGKPVAVRFLGYEQIEEGIYSYWQADNVASVRSLGIMNNILYEYKKEQISLIHATVNGVRKSTKMVNPEDKAELNF